MKILIYGINFAPEVTGIGKYTADMADWLSVHGNSVRVVTAPPYYPDWVISSGYSAWRWRREDWRGVKVWRCPLWVPLRPGGAKRILHLLSFAFSSFPVMVRQVFWRPDVVWVVEPALCCAPVALAVARLSGAKTWLHVQDYEVDAAFGLGLLNGVVLRRFVLVAERWLMRRFDIVSTISQRMLERAQTKGVSAGKLIAFHNWVDTITLAQPTSSGMQSYRDELGLPADAVVALYSGNMGAKQGLELLAEVARLHATTGTNSSPLIAVWFVFCGNGVARPKLVEECRGMTHVRFLDLQPAERLADLLGMADIHLLPQRSDAADLVMPSKLTGMLASARPVVVTAHAGTELANVVQHCGIVVSPEDAQAMADAVQALAADSAERTRLGQAGLRHAVAHMDRDAVLENFERQLRALVAGRQVPIIF